jgi:hypothetical protein
MEGVVSQPTGPRRRAVRPLPSRPRGRRAKVGAWPPAEGAHRSLEPGPPHLPVRLRWAGGLQVVGVEPRHGGLQHGLNARARGWRA